MGGFLCQQDRMCRSAAALDAVHLRDSASLRLPSNFLGFRGAQDQCPKSAAPRRCSV